MWVVQPDHLIDAPKYGKQWFNYTDAVDPTLESGAYGSDDLYGGVVDPATGFNDNENLSGGLPGVAAGGANRVFIPTSFEGGDNPVSKAKLQLNGHDRFAEMDGRYFNLVQPFQHHENVPSRGINVYSFGLKPEEHQPSGTCNFSRIDSANLNLTLTADTLKVPAVGGGAPTAGTAKIRVYAVNYNVLRIMSGMGYRKTAHKSVKKSLVGFQNLRHLQNAGISLQIQTTKVLKCLNNGQSAAKPFLGRYREQMEMGIIKKSLRYVPAEIIIFGSCILQLNELCCSSSQFRFKSYFCQYLICKVSSIVSIDHN